MHISRLVVALALFAATAGACSQFGDDDTADGASMVDRAAVDAELTEIGADALDGNSPFSGVRLEDGECPFLGESTVAELVGKADIGVDVEDAEPTGLLVWSGDGLNISCDAHDDDNDITVSVTLAQVQDLTVAEFLERQAASPISDDLDFDDNIKHPAFSDGSLLVRSDGPNDTVAWIDNGLLLSVFALEDGNDLAQDDQLELLAVARDAALETLQGSSDGSGHSLGRPDGIDRADALAALRSMQSGDGPETEPFDEGPCPFLDDDQVEGLADELGWEVDVDDVRGQVSPGNLGVRCTWRDGSEPRSIAVRFHRAVTVAEFESVIEELLTDQAAMVDAIESDDPLLEDRAFILEEGVVNRAGWIDNGLFIEVNVGSGDVEEALAEVVPTVLESLGVDAP